LAGAEPVGRHLAWHLAGRPHPRPARRAPSQTARRKTGLDRGARPLQGAPGNSRRPGPAAPTGSVGGRDAAPTEGRAIALRSGAGGGGRPDVRGEWVDDGPVGGGPIPLARPRSGGPADPRPVPAKPARPDVGPAGAVAAVDGLLLFPATAGDYFRRLVCS